MAFNFVSPDKKQQGKKGEAIFQSWLDNSNVPYGYFEQGSWSFPRKLAEKMKRPDFLVGIIGLGAFAFDVKTAKMTEEGFTIRKQEAVQLGNFQSYFNQTVFYAFIPPEHNYTRCCLISNDQFLMYGNHRTGRYGDYIVAQGEDCDWIDLTQETFLDALRKQIELTALT